MLLMLHTTGKHFLLTSEYMSSQITTICQNRCDQWGVSMPSLTPGQPGQICLPWRLGVKPLKQLKKENWEL